MEFSVHTGALALRGGRQTMALQDIANRLIADFIPQIGECPHNPVIAPISVLPGHADDQLLHLSADARPTRASTGLRAIEFARHHRAVPSGSAENSRGTSWDMSHDVPRVYLTHCSTHVEPEPKILATFAVPVTVTPGRF